MMYFAILVTTRSTNHHQLLELVNGHSAVSTYHLIQLMNALNLKSYEITVVLTVQL